MLNKKLYKPVIIGMMLILTFAKAAADSFLDYKKPIITIEDKYREMEAWGTCVATYELISELQKKSSPAVSKQLSQLANGAKIALFFSYLTGISENASDKEVIAREEMARVFMDSVPETKLTAIMSAGEITNYGIEWENRLFETLNQCLENGDDQQFLVDSWRSLMASGAYSFN